jgi:hypothetical protein
MGKILIAVPHGGAIEPDTLVSIYNMDLLPGVETELKLFYGYGVDVARNRASDYALKKQFSHVLFVDADMELKADTLSRLLSHSKDIVSAVYVKKVEDRKMIEAFVTDDYGKTSRTISETELAVADIVKVGSVGFGCVLVSTAVLERVGFPQFRYTEGKDAKTTFGEDIYFCMKASSLYYEIFLSTKTTVSHIGKKKYTI